MKIRCLPFLPAAMIVALLLVSCEKINLNDYISSGSDGGNASSSDGGFTVTLRVDDYSLSDFDGGNEYDSAASRAKVAASELGNRLNLVIYQDGERLKYVNQESGADNFGTVSVNLSEGTYELLVLVHSCTGNATTTDAEAIKFPNNKVTDTFSYYRDDLEVTGDTSYDITLTRRVAMYRFTINGTIPDNVTQMQFYYTGGSSTFDAVTGFGCVNSRQTETRDVVSHESGQTFEVYTFPHNITDELKMTITALDASGTAVHEVVYENVPVELNKITTHTASFFNDETGNTGGTSTGGGPQFVVKGDNAWSGEIIY